jgi:hypothetical protein
MSSFAANNSSSANNNSGTSTTSAEKTLASALSILQNNDIALELLPPKSDIEGWRDLQTTLGLSYAQTLALKKHVEAQTQAATPSASASPQKAKQPEVVV